MARPLLSFFLLTYAVSWTCFTAGGAMRHGDASTDPVSWGLSDAVLLLGTVTPSLVALALTRRSEGDGGVGALLDQVVAWRVRIGWYVFAIAFMPVIKLTVALVHRATTGAWPRLGQEPWYVLAAAILISTWVQAGEEIGWRGYALPRLTERFGPALASIVLGFLWATWHLPLFFVQGSDKLGQSFPLYALQVTALSVAMAWLYWRTGRSLLLVMLLHAAVNNTSGIVPSSVLGAGDPFALSTSLVGWLTAAFLWIAAGLFIVQMQRSAGRAEAPRVVASPATRA